jgi:hypothetical protein
VIVAADALALLSVIVRVTTLVCTDVPEKTLLTATALFTVRVVEVELYAMLLTLPAGTLLVWTPGVADVTVKRMAHEPEPVPEGAAGIVPPVSCACVDVNEVDPAHVFVPVAVTVTFVGIASVKSAEVMAFVLKFR